MAGGEANQDDGRGQPPARRECAAAFPGFDRTRYPIWRDWLAGAAAHPRRAEVIEWMRQAGALDLPGAADGW